jgi:hypothetical protein
VNWEVEFHKDFDPEFDALPEDAQNELRAHALLLERFGPQLGRPRVDTLKGSRHANMKELRFYAAGGAWRSLSIPSATRSCWSQETSRAAAKKILPPVDSNS